MKNIISIFLFCFVYASDFAQDTLALEGHYYGKNLYIINPTCGSDTVYGVTQVLVNGKTTKDEVKSNSFEVDFSLLEIGNAEAVDVAFIYTKGCKPKIINPDVLQPQSTFAFVSAKPDKTGKITWIVKGELFSSFSIEQYRWKKWITLGDVDNTDTLRKNTYVFDIKPHYGPNLLRISHSDLKGNTVYSKSVKFRSATAKEIFISSLKVTDAITFSGETAFEIFDEKGNFLLDGTGSEVSITELPKGKYWVNYDNKTEIVTKK
ncbi:MAG: hypothetical protein V1904_13020 [Bacteroidota bacterium]